MNILLEVSGYETTQIYSRNTVMLELELTDEQAFDVLRGMACNGYSVEDFAKAVEEVFK